MLNGYIKIEDILEIFKNIDQIDGYVNKQEFQKSVAVLKSHRKPKQQKQPKIILKKSTLSDMNANIRVYQNNIDSNYKSGDLYLFIKDKYNIEISKNTIISSILYKVTDKINENSLVNKNAILENNSVILIKEKVVCDKLLSILGISKNKYYRLKKMGIIDIYNASELIIKRDHFDTKCGGIFFYDLNEIRNNIKNSQ